MKEGPPLLARPITRAEAQARLDDLYGRGRITLEQWRARKDIVGEPLIKNYDGLYNER